MCELRIDIRVMIHEIIFIKINHNVEIFFFFFLILEIFEFI